MIILIKILSIAAADLMLHQD